MKRYEIDALMGEYDLIPDAPATGKRQVWDRGPGTLAARIATTIRLKFWSRLTLMAAKWLSYFGRDEAERLFAQQSRDDLRHIDEETRRTYAEAVARSLRIGGWQRELFVELRMVKVWLWTTIEGFDNLVGVIRRTVGVWHDRGPVNMDWAIPAAPLAKAMKKGLNVGQLERILRMTRWLWEEDRQFCMATKCHTYQRGLHVGDYLTDLFLGIRKEHLIYFNTYMRVLKHTMRICPKFTGRYLRVLQNLSDEALRLTVTDSRNWGGEFYGRTRPCFRLLTIVRNASDWMPLRKAHKTDKAWLAFIGRVPKNQLVRKVGDRLVSQLTRKSFKLFLDGFQKTMGEHDVIALMRLVLWFGQDWRKYVTDTGVNIHDAGINLSDAPFADGVKFLKRYVHRHQDAQRVVGSWQVLQDHGIDPMSKGGLDTAHAVLCSLVYEGIEDFDFAKECAKAGYSQQSFDRAQDWWLGAINAPVYESIPRVDIVRGDWRFYRLAKDDTRGPFLGNYTGCCQHLSGAGASCARHGVESPDGAFVVLEYRGVVKFQSWVWRYQDALVFDNIEGSGRARPEASEIYLEGMRAFKGKFGIKYVFTGLGNTDMPTSGMEMRCPVPAPSGCYTDAETVKEV